MPIAVPPDQLAPADTVVNLQVKHVLTDQLNTRPTEADEDLHRLAASLTHGQIQPITVRRNEHDGIGPQTYTVITGHRRLAAMKLANLPVIRAIIVESSRSDKDILLDRIAENKARKDLTALQQVDAICRAVTADPDLPRKVLAEKTGYSESEISKAIAIKDCAVAYAALVAGIVTSLSTAYAIAKAAPDLKQGLLAMSTAGATRDQLLTATRKPRKQGEKVTRMAISLPGGVSVTLSGMAMDIDQTIEHLAECLKAARRARDEGLTARSWISTMRDKAKGG